MWFVCFLALTSTLIYQKSQVCTKTRPEDQFHALNERRWALMFTDIIFACCVTSFFALIVHVIVDDISPLDEKFNIDPFVGGIVINALLIFFCLLSYLTLARQERRLLFEASRRSVEQQQEGGV
jgi:hypothetical protein